MTTEIGDYCGPKEDLVHWKNIALDYKSRWTQLQEEFADFQANSKELEDEFESQIKGLEKKNKELMKLYEQLKFDSENAYERSSKQRQQDSKLINELQSRLSIAEDKLAEQHTYITKLEIDNDKLENAHRAIASSLEYAQQKLDEQTEKVVFLTFENEDLAVSEKTLKKQLKELKYDTACHEVASGGDEKDTMSTSIEADSCSIATPIRTKEVVDKNIIPNHFTESLENTPLQSAKHSNARSTPSTPLTPQACITAIGIVNDLMRRFGSIESKLAAIRSSSNKQNRLRPNSNLPSEENANGIGPSSSDSSKHKSTSAVPTSSRWSSFFRLSFFSDGETEDKSQAL